jgi:hypothetical protein
MPDVASSRLRSTSSSFARVLPGAKLVPFPAFIPPCLALARNKVATARGLVHELKYSLTLEQNRIRRIAGMT